ncbi:MAG: MFS transporter [Candidatus Thorarchaeota archaeon]|nr:MFS transporter [Candidatus Thorarchaeota archaeon]
MDSELGYLDKVRKFRRDARLYILTGMMTAFSFGISNVIFNLYFLEVGFGEDFIGFFLSISLFASSGIALIAGVLSDRVSRKKMVIIANLVSLIAFFVQYTFLNPIGLIISQAVLGLAIAFNSVSWSPYITELTTNEERAHLFGVSGGLSLLSVLAGNILGGFLPGLLLRGFEQISSLAIAYRWTLWLSLIPYAIGILVIFSMTGDTPDVSSLVRFSRKDVKHWGFIGRYALVVATVGLGAGMIVMFFNIFFSAEATFGASPELIGIIFGINTIVLAIGNFVAPALADRFGKVRTVVVTELFSIPFLLMIAWATTLELAVLAYVSRTALMNMAGPVSQAFFMESLTKNERSTASGIVNTGDSFARGIAANIGGWLLAQGFYRLPYLLVSGLYLLAVILFYVFFHDKEKELKARESAEILKEPSKELEFDST